MSDHSQRARAHAKHSHFCTCGKVVHGNGGKANHRAMHKRRDDGHYFTTQSGYYGLFPNAKGAPALPDESAAEYQARIGSEQVGGGS